MVGCIHKVFFQRVFANILVTWPVHFNWKWCVMIGQRIKMWMMVYVVYVTKLKQWQIINTFDLNFRNVAFTFWVTITETQIESINLYLGRWSGQEASAPSTGSCAAETVWLVRSWRLKRQTLRNHRVWIFLSKSYLWRLLTRRFAIGLWWRGLQLGFQKSIS